jgi:membrane-anchored protein YejM (alkaline phosphatase superfamily)
MAQLGIAEDTAIIVSADHGESFGENGSYAEHGLANEAVHRLRPVVYWPGIIRSRTSRSVSTRRASARACTRQLPR